MADNKKSFVLYSDWASVFSKLTDEEAGKLIKHLFDYVNEVETDLENRLLEITFEPIKLQLKRDLLKYEKIRNERSKAGQAGGFMSGKARRCVANEANASIEKQNEANEAVNENGTDTDFKEKIIKKEIEFKESIKPFIPIYGKDICNKFYLYWSEPNKSKTKLRYEMEKTWDVSRRLANWANRDKAFNTRINGTGAEPNYQKL